MKLVKAGKLRGDNLGLISTLIDNDTSIKRLSPPSLPKTERVKPKTSHRKTSKFTSFNQHGLDLPSLPLGHYRMFWGVRVAVVVPLDFNDLRADRQHEFLGQAMRVGVWLLVCPESARTLDGYAREKLNRSRMLPE